jgi:hypothetical protein
MAVLALIGVIALVVGAYRVGRDDGERIARMAGEDTQTAQAVAAPAPFPEPLAPQDEPEIDDDEDVCLRPGTRVFCRLSDRSHTHGVLVGFGMASPEGPMIAMVSLAPGTPLMPIDVDLVDPTDDENDDGGGPEIPKPKHDAVDPHLN